MPRLALFDLDRTLIAVNSATGWIKREVRLGFLTRRQAMHGVYQIAKYQLGFSRMEQTIEDAVRALTGDEEAAVAQRTLDFWREEVASTIRPGARAALQAHLDAGDHVALLTSSSDYMCRAVAEELPFEQWGCNRFEVLDGRFTGEVYKPLCYAEGKVAHAEALASEHGLSLQDCVFYTDSYSDLAGLQAVGEPVVVHPDPRLARHARRQGWRVVDWGP